MDMNFALGRTYHPKYPHYRGDGSGRDQYVLTNNGGMLPMEGQMVARVGY